MSHRHATVITDHRSGTEAARPKRPALRPQALTASVCAGEEKWAGGCSLPSLFQIDSATRTPAGDVASVLMLCLDFTPRLGKIPSNGARKYRQYTWMYMKLDFQRKDHKYDSQARRLLQTYTSSQGQHQPPSWLLPNRFDTVRRHAAFFSLIRG